MKALIFDLDDTLYHQEQPFKRAVQAHLPVQDEQMEALVDSSERKKDFQMFFEKATNDHFLI